MNNGISYISGPSDTPLLGETIGQNLFRTVQRFPEQEALISIGQNYRATYADFYRQTTEVAQALLALGVYKGDRVGIWSANRYEWVLIQYATARIGAILVNINPAYRAHELAFVLNQSEVGYLFSELRFKSSNYVEIIDSVKAECPGLKSVVYFDRNWENFLKSAGEIPETDVSEIEASLQFDDPINIQYTSGTTGFPKGVTLTHHNIQNNGYFIGKRLNYTEKDRVCIPVPFYHCFGMVIGNLCCTAYGSAIIIPSDSFDPKLTLQAVEKEHCTSLYGVPTMFIAELALEDFEHYNLSSLRTGVMAGSPCPIEIMKQVQARMNMSEVTICYGMTETAPVSVQTKIGAPLEKQVTTVGTAHDHLEIKIIDPETGNIVPTGTHGEFCVRGYSVMQKYWNNPEATASVIDENGWMHSGDLALMDEEGYISITGRIKDLIIRGGENISPKEIEDFLYKHPYIQDAQVIGIPSEKFGEEVMAWIKLHGNHNLTEEELVTYCKNQIAHYKIPRFWKFVTEFPMTVSGKIRKVEMREIAVRELREQGKMK